MTGRGRTLENFGQLLEPAGNTRLERHDVRRHRFGRAAIRFRKDDDERQCVAREPLHKFQIYWLRFQTGINQQKHAAEIWPVLEVIRHRAVELRDMFPRTFGVTVAGQIYKAPRFAHRKKIDELCETRRGRDARQPLDARERVQQRRLADVRAADEGEFRQRLVWARGQIRRAAIKDGG